ncbi:MAG: GGDEF domain-containing protein [Lachnospiraceae bacterium]|nr:GGDEF domain-containing protein [Lachnospiraceae bacterium]
MKVWDLINKDVRSITENKKVMVVIRVNYLFVFFAYILDMIVAGAEIFALKWPVFCGFVAAMIILFLFTYYSKTVTSLWLFMAYIFIMTEAMIPIFGWTAGFQNYLIVCLVMVYFGSCARLRTKLFFSFIVLLARFLLIILFVGTDSLVEIPIIMEKLLQGVNITAVYSALIFLSYTFSKNEKEQERKLVKYNDELQKEANTDRLTGLYNRRRADDYIAELKEFTGDKPISIAIADIDFFKKVNDTYGHDAGDEVLKNVASILNKSVRSNTFVARWGGEEFVIILTDCNGDDAFSVLERIRRNIKDNPTSVGNTTIDVTLTFGLVEYDFSGDFEKCIKQADENLYYGKSHGRDQIVY